MCGGHTPTTTHQPAVRCMHAPRCRQARVCHVQPSAGRWEARALARGQCRPHGGPTQEEATLRHNASWHWAISRMRRYCLTVDQGYQMQPRKLQRNGWEMSDGTRPRRAVWCRTTYMKPGQCRALHCVNKLSMQFADEVEARTDNHPTVRVASSKQRDHTLARQYSNRGVQGSGFRS